MENDAQYSILTLKMTRKKNNFHYSWLSGVQIQLLQHSFLEGLESPVQNVSSNSILSIVSKGKMTTKSPFSTWKDLECPKREPPFLQLDHTREFRLPASRYRCFENMMDRNRGRYSTYPRSNLGAGACWDIQYLLRRKGCCGTSSTCHGICYFADQKPHSSGSNDP